VTWQPVVILANINVQHPVETAHAALFAGEDGRVTQVFDQQPILARLLNHFTDAFGRKEYPSVIALRQNLPPTYNKGRAISSFRDVIATSAIPLNRAHAIQAKHGIFAPLFANSFDFYPWMLGSDRQWLVALTPALMGLDTADRFSGQTSPEVPALLYESPDEPLLKALLNCWERRFSTSTPARATVLFSDRSTQPLKLRASRLSRQAIPTTSPVSSRYG
jgi:hypothetical protein